MIPQLIFPGPIMFEKYYAGRRSTLEHIKATLVAGRSSIVVGERRFGKSSTSNVIQTYLKNLPNQGFIPLVIEQISDSLALKNYTFQIMCENILKQLGNHLEDTDKTSTPKPTRFITVEHFEETFLKLLKLDSQPDKTQYVLCLDEFENLVEYPDNPVERSLIMEFVGKILTGKTRLPMSAFLTLTYIPESYINSPYSSSLEQVFLETLQPLSQAELAEILKNELVNYPYSEKIPMVWLMAQSGGVPFYFKLLLQHFLRVFAQNGNPAEITSSLLSDVMDSAIRDQNAYLALTNIYKMRFTEQERILMLLLANRAISISNYELKLLSGSYSGAMRNLMSRYYLEQKQNRFDFRIGLWGEWLRHWDNYGEECERLGLDTVIHSLENVVIEISRREGKARIKGELLSLSFMEFRLLTAMAEKAEQLITKDNLLTSVWGTNYNNFGTLDVNLNRLRAELNTKAPGKNYIEAVRGQGVILHDAKFVD